MSREEIEEYLESHPIPHHSKKKKKMKVGGVINVGFSEKPHPFKNPNNPLAPPHRSPHETMDGIQEVCEDPSLSEDAAFILSIPSSPVTYLCVMDGVGSWREVGINPQNFSHSLNNHLKEVIVDHYFGLPNTTTPPKLALSHLLQEGVDLIKREGIEGSSTVTFCRVDMEEMYLEYINVGDSGVGLYND